MDKKNLSEESNTDLKNKCSFIKTKRIYISMMSIYELADKLFGSTYIAFMRSKNISINTISTLFSIKQLLLAIFDYPTGTISDKYGRKKVASLGFIVWGLSIVIFSNANNFITFLPSMVFMALGLALISGAPSAWLIDHMIKNDVYDKKSEILPKIQTFITRRIYFSFNTFVCIN